MPVYNITCSDAKKQTWQEVLDKGKRVCYQYPFEAGLWYPNGDMTTSQIVHKFNVIMYHWLPAYFIDFLMLCFGQKRLYVEDARLHQLTKSIISYFVVVFFFTI